MSYYAAKISLVSWWILAIMSLFLWYRNENYDRALAIFILTLGLLQLIEYGIQSGANPDQSGRALFITLWLQCLVLSLGVYIFIKTMNTDNKSNVTQIVAGVNLFIFTVVFVVGLIYAILTDNKHIINLEGSLLGHWTWLYILGIIIPLILLLSYYNWYNIGVMILIIYTLVSFSIIILGSAQTIRNMWAYLTVGFAFLVWIIGMFPTTQLTK